VQSPPDPATAGSRQAVARTVCLLPCVTLGLHSALFASCRRLPRRREAAWRVRHEPGVGGNLDYVTVYCFQTDLLILDSEPDAPWAPRRTIRTPSLKTTLMTN